jgi:hypothetical protein
MAGLLSGIYKNLIEGAAKPNRSLLTRQRPQPQPRQLDVDPLEGEFRVVPDELSSTGGQPPRQPPTPDASVGPSNAQKAALGGAGALGVAGAVNQFTGGDDPEAQAANEEHRTKVEQTILADSKAEVVKTLTAQGASVEDAEAEAGFMDKFNDNFDLFTLGATLLANNDGQSNLGANIGRAFLASRQTKIAESKKGKRDALEERKVAASELTAEASMARAIASQTAAGKKASGITTRPPTRTELAATQSVLSNLVDVNLKLDQKKKPGQYQFISDATIMVKQENARRKASGIPEMAPTESRNFLTKYIESLQDPTGSGVTKPGFFGKSFNKDALNQGAPVLNQRQREMQALQQELQRR